MESKKIMGHLDSAGAFASIACAMHCIALPFLLTVLPLLGLSVLADHSFEKAVLVFTVFLGLTSLCWGTRVHGRRYTLVFLFAAICFFTISHFIFPGHHYLFMTAGGLSLAAGHILNMRLCKTCSHCEHPST